MFGIGQGCESDRCICYSWVMSRCVCCVNLLYEVGVSWIVLGLAVLRSD